MAFLIAESAECGERREESSHPLLAFSAFGKKQAYPGGGFCIR
jgi:hypothetical protein